MAALASSKRLVSSASAARCPAALPVARRCAVVVRAEPDAATQQPVFTLDNTRNSAEGYVEKDTAGQSNMYPTITKAYEVGSSLDSTSSAGAATNALAGVFGGIAISLIVVGLIAISSSGGSGEPEQQFKSLSEYAALFAQ